MASRFYQVPVNVRPQRSVIKTLVGSRTKKVFLNIIIPILVGMAIGTVATFILKIAGGKISF